jgi:hypothetical protein
VTLRELEAYFVRYEVRDGVTYHVHVATLAEAQGITFLCPACYAKNCGPVGTHSVLCWFAGRGIADDVDPKPGRWNPTGTGLDDLTFVGPGSFSVWLQEARCAWHGFVSNGCAS